MKIELGEETEAVFQSCLEFVEADTESGCVTALAIIAVGVQISNKLDKLIEKLGEK